MRAGALVFLLLWLAAPAMAEERRAGPVDAPQGPYNRQEWWVPIAPPASGGHVFLLETVVYRPTGAGPFPLVTLNHGKPRAGAADPGAMHPGYVAAAHWFVDRGFAVAVPMRPGYGRSDGVVADTVGSCDNRDYFATARLVAAEIEGAVAYLQRQSFVDPKNVVVLGKSYGGLGALGVAYDAPQGVVGIVNFAGGAGSFAPQRICGGDSRLIDAVGRLGERAAVPEIWLYAANDQFFAPPLAHAMYAAYRAHAQSPVTFVDLPAFGADGHLLFDRGNPDLWTQPVARFLAGLPTRR